MHALRRILRWIAYPVVIAAAVTNGVLGLARGLPPWLVVGASTVAAGGLAFLFEWAIPYRQEWSQSHGDEWTDAGHAFLSGPPSDLIRGAMVGGMVALATWISAHAGGGIWPTSWPLALQVVLALVVAELGNYWAHRLQHSTWLWRFHAIHHSAPRLYFFNSLRIHPGDHVSSAIFSLAPLALLGAPLPALVLFACVSGAHMLMQHANVDVRLGPLNWVLSMAEVHRWHHSRRFEEMNANYGGVLLIWDLVFGTRFFPPDRRIEPEDVVGLADVPEFPTRYLAQLAAPFRARFWRR
jgi:sterol desaturase/sphingolipid hydroxylase (fatty acid hydroxylase superfamily)